MAKNTTTTITVKSISVSMDTNDFRQLMRNHAKNVKRIKDIQRVVSSDYDNIGNPVPLFEQI